MPPGFNRNKKFSLFPVFFAAFAFAIAHGVHGYVYFNRPGGVETSWQRWGKIFSDAWPNPPFLVNILATIINPDIKSRDETTLLNVLLTLMWMLVLNWLSVYMYEMFAAAIMPRASLLAAVARLRRRVVVVLVA